MYRYIYTYRVKRGLRAAHTFMCGPWYVLEHLAFHLFCGPFLTERLFLCVLGRCALHRCMLSVWSVVCGLRAAWCSCRR